ncbi:biotin--[acetyl-CoA-carboxylase] ligase [Herpetosiphon sp. NSE202]|uniref:biotin--[acetyl-CoA-carboxylase] ligase n=1 Tax=Herpetosiphon sp. NSE202 TaxID=3351349 RepID=UPI00363B7973
MLTSFEQTIIEPARYQLETLIIGQELLGLEQTASTNSLIRERAFAGVAEGLVIVANEQTAGRGRRGRSWSAPAGSSLLLSLLLRPTWLVPSESFLLTMLAAVAISEAIERETSCTVELKWPNDLLINGRKLAGILVELETAGPERLRWAVIGSGINVNWQPTDDPTINQAATSLASECGHEVDRAGLLRAILHSYDRHYLNLRSGRREALRQAWLDRLTTLGKAVEVELSTHSFVGVAEAVDQHGGLQVRDSTGQLQTVYAGNVKVRPLAQA